MILKIFYTNEENIGEHRMPINKELVLSKESEDDTMEEGFVVVSKWDLEEWKQIEIRNAAALAEQAKTQE